MKNGKPCVLGLKCGGNPNGDGHSANAAIKCGNEIVAIQAERLDRIKKSAGWKKGTKNFESLTRNDCEFVGIKDCVQYCLDAFGISNQNIIIFLIAVLAALFIILGSVSKLIKIRKRRK